MVSDIREQSGADVGLRTALDREYDRTIEEELDGIDDPLGITVKKGPKKRVCYLATVTAGADCPATRVASLVVTSSPRLK